MYVFLVKQMSWDLFLSVTFDYIKIMDTAGPEDSYMKNGQAFVLIYSVTSPTSFDSAAKIYQLIRRVCMACFIFEG